ncbi:haloalkane dehalogenase [Streptomyces sp. 3213]|nr:haloalkane dehalogenase [Streptomyces sp. 3213] [Streptomyces sp. 3213.3]
MTTPPVTHVLDSTMTHRESGTGAPIVFLHGKPAISYDVADQARHLDAWFDALGLRDVVLAGHDWGGALAFDWAAVAYRTIRTRRSTLT